MENTITALVEIKVTNEKRNYAKGEAHTLLNTLKEVTNVTFPETHVVTDTANNSELSQKLAQLIKEEIERESGYHNALINYVVDKTDLENEFLGEAMAKIIREVAAIYNNLQTI